MMRTNFSTRNMFTLNGHLNGQRQGLHEGLTHWDLGYITLKYPKGELSGSEFLGSTFVRAFQRLALLQTGEVYKSACPLS